MFARTKRIAFRLCGASVRLENYACSCQRDGSANCGVRRPVEDLMSAKSMFLLYAVCTVVFVLVAIYIFPLLGAKPNPPAWAAVLHMFDLDRFL